MHTDIFYFTQLRKTEKLSLKMPNYRLAQIMTKNNLNI